MKSETKEIIICNNCNGDGKELEKTGAHDPQLVDCSKCGGSGRLVKIITYTPFVNSFYS